jgi:hypothetical protein
MEKLIDILFYSFGILVLIILYRLLLKRLSKGKINLESYCTLYSLEKNPACGEIEFYFVAPELMKVEFSIWKENEKLIELRSEHFKKGGHIVRYDSTQLADGEYFFGIITSNQRTIKRFNIKNN